jgi:hypothetical protein
MSRIYNKLVKWPRKVSCTLDKFLARTHFSMFWARWYDRGYLLVIRVDNLYKLVKVCHIYIYIYKVAKIINNSAHSIDLSMFVLTFFLFLTASICYELLNVYHFSSLLRKTLWWKPSNNVNIESTLSSR